MTAEARARRACRVSRARRGRQVEAGPSRGQSMDVVAIAVTGASGLVGQRLLPRLADDDRVTRLIALDVRDPRRRVRNLEFQRVDIGGAELKPLLDAAEVLVHLATVVDPIPDETLMARVNIEGTRRVLEAAADVERLLGDWREEHPAVTVTTLRSAPVLGAGAERLPSRLLLGRPPLRVRGASPPVQVVHVDDLVDALLLAVGHDLPGTYNVAADGWLGADDARALLPRSLLPALPEELLERMLRRLWASGLGDIPPTVVPYLVHPWVVANDRLHAAGWDPRHTNEEAIIEGLDSLPAPSYARSLVLAAGGAVVAGVVAGLGWRWRIRRRRRRSARGT